MYKCEDCGAVFAEPYVYHEWDVGYVADWCPECHSDDIVEVEECQMCGEWTPRHLLEDGFCDACISKTARKLDEWLSHQDLPELEIFEKVFGIEPINY